jgi:hypothetical protein
MPCPVRSGPMLYCRVGMSCQPMMLCVVSCCPGMPCPIVCVILSRPIRVSVCLGVCVFVCVCVCLCVCVCVCVCVSVFFTCLVLTQQLFVCTYFSSFHYCNVLCLPKPAYVCKPQVRHATWVTRTFGPASSSWYVYSWRSVVCDLLSCALL